MGREHRILTRGIRCSLPIPQGEVLWIATDRFDLEAETIATIYKRRWTVEIFFRFFKHVLGCRHLLSYNQNGIELQVYAAIIACMLISLWTGGQKAYPADL